MKYYDVVENAGLSEKAKALGYEKIFSVNELNVIHSPEYDEAMKKCRQGTLLLDPFNEKRTLIDPVLAKRIAEKNAAVLISLKQIALRKGMKRASWLHSIMLTIRICKKHGAEIVIGSLASGPEGLKTPRMLESVGQSLGLTKPQARWACTHAWEKVIRQ